MGLETLRQTKVYFDANLFIYAIEDHDDYRAQILQLFQHLYEHNCQIVSSELTYAECLVKPLKEQDEESIKNYEKTLIDSGSIQLMPVTLNVLRHAAIFRAKHATKLPDAIHVETDDRKLPAIEEIEFIFLKDLYH